MNHFRTIDTDYLRPSRTLETIEVSNNSNSKLVYLYNHEGNSYRLFYSHINFINFFQNQAESAFHFSSENELDAYLEKMKVD